MATRAHSAYGNGKVIAAVVKAGARFSFTMARNVAIDTVIASIPDECYTPVQFPGAVTDPDTGQLVSDADITHRRHAICETVWSDLIDGPWAHQPSGSFGAKAAWSIPAAVL